MHTFVWFSFNGHAKWVIQHQKKREATSPSNNNPEDLENNRTEPQSEESKDGIQTIATVNEQIFSLKSNWIIGRGDDKVEAIFVALNRSMFFSVDFLKFARQ